MNGLTKMTKEEIIRCYEWYLKPPQGAGNKSRPDRLCHSGRRSVQRGVNKVHDQLAGVV